MYKCICAYIVINTHVQKHEHMYMHAHSFYTNSKGRGLHFYPMIGEVVMLQEAQSYPC